LTDAIVNGRRSSRKAIGLRIPARLGCLDVILSRIALPNLVRDFLDITWSATTASPHRRPRKPKELITALSKNRTPEISPLSARLTESYLHGQACADASLAVAGSGRDLTSPPPAHPVGYTLSAIKCANRHCAPRFCNCGPAKGLPQSRRLINDGHHWHLR
jgi:hypothetical protein